MSGHVPVMTGRDRQRIRALRDHATRLRRLADEITVEPRSRRKLSHAPVLGGRALVDAAIVRSQPVRTSATTTTGDRAWPLLLVRRGSNCRPRGTFIRDRSGLSALKAVLVRFGMYADSENAALSSPDVGDAIPADVVEGGAFSGP